MFKINILFFTLFLFSTTNSYSSSSCYNISNKDKKNMCLAKSKTQSSYCYNISNNDTKNMCIAVVKGKKSYCYNIKSRDEKNVCLSNF